MRYSRGRIIALAILSVTMALALSCTGFVVDLVQIIARAADTTNTYVDPNYVPGFDDLYKRIPFDVNDTGTTKIGQETKLTLLEERYEKNVLTDFLNTRTRGSYPELQNKRLSDYPYPLFSDTQMREIAKGGGSALDVPVIMLDPYNYDDIVLFELTNLYDVPGSGNISITRNGDEINMDDSAVSGSLGADYVYAGLTEYIYTGKTVVVYDPDKVDDDGKKVEPLMNVIFAPISPDNSAYYVEIKDPNGDYFYTKDGDVIETIPNGATIDLCTIGESGNYKWVYQVSRNNGMVEVYSINEDGRVDERIDTVEYNENDSRMETYKIGAVAYNGNALRGMFQAEGVYEISFKQRYIASDGMVNQVNINFAFIIVNKIHYTNFPRFNTKNRVLGNSEIYNYSYENSYPTVSYPAQYFDVTVTPDSGYNPPKEEDGTHVYQFYGIGEYRMKSEMQYYNVYLRGNKKFENRGVDLQEGIVKLSRYTSYSSVLNIFGFQAYYGGYHSDEEYKGPKAFYDKENANISSDISAWVRNAKMTAADSRSVTDYTNMRVSDALAYSTELARYLTDQGRVPVRTNFPPVKIVGNVAHATGSGNGESSVVLSSVAFKPSSGTGLTSEWTSSTLDVGAPFEEAGQYVVTIYFKVNGEINQQTFFFEIVNSARIDFEVDVIVDGETKTVLYHSDDLTLNQTLIGSQIRLSYDGSTTLGQFEVPPTITLQDTKGEIIKKGNGAFDFKLETGEYQLIIQYGAHWKSTSVFSIIVDNSQATGITAKTNANKLTGLPANMAIVGSGEVNLTWNLKANGINYNNVLVEYYKLALENDGVNPNADRNYTNFNLQNVDEARLYTAYAFAETPYKFELNPVKTTAGNAWTLKDPLSDAGWYNITLIDDIGNETHFVLIIDSSLPTFVQSGAKPSIAANAVLLDEKGVYLGFGKRKLIPSQSNAMLAVFSEAELTQLRQAGILVTEDRTIGKTETNAGIVRSTTSLSIGFNSIEYSESGERYVPINEKDPAWNNGYMLLQDEGTYYFRVIDKLGNVGEYYIITTYDNSFGMIYADTIQPTVSQENNFVGRGIVISKPSSSTGLVTSTGGMTNRPYVTFSFEQKGRNDKYNVDKVYMQYFPLTYDLDSPNYPFAKDCLADSKLFDFQDGYQGSSRIYQYRDGDEGTTGGSTTIRLALFGPEIKNDKDPNKTTSIRSNTPNGMYILTRKYSYHDNTSNDPEFRHYYFIVDDQKMLYYAEGQFETALKILFASSDDKDDAKYPKGKTADAAVIDRYNKKLSSDRMATIYGYSSKYAWKHTAGTRYTFNKQNFHAGADFFTNDEYVFDFPSLMPRFSYTNSNQTKILGEGADTMKLGDPTEERDSNMYQLIVADNARSVSCMLVNGNLVEIKDADTPTSANYDYLTLFLDTGYGKKAEIVLDDGVVINNARMEYDAKNDNYLYVVDPQTINTLQFCFQSDPASDTQTSTESMYSSVNIKTTTASWKSEGFMHNVSFRVPEPTEDNYYVFDLMDDFLSGREIPNGSSLSVTLSTYDGLNTNYTILFDTVNPSYNLGRVCNGDNLARTLGVMELPGRYVYGLSNDFVFRVDHENNRYLDTQIITYREVDYLGDGTQQAVEFTLADGEDGIPFADLVGLRSNEMKYYIITEIDYAGHRTSYRVQIQGALYANDIAFIGAITDEKAKTQIGIEMHASASSVHQFFLHNNSFKFESGDEYYMVLDNTATWHIGGKTGTEVKSEESLINALNNWINNATENGTKCSYVLYNRMGDPVSIEFYNLRENAVQIQLDCYQTTPTSDVVTLIVTNLDRLPKILFEEYLASLFKIEIEDKTNPGSPPSVPFSLYGTQIAGYATHELIIKVTDPFGRVSMTEYHQQLQSTINFTVYGNTVTKGGVIYVGDERGVRFSYLRTVYDVVITDAATGEALDIEPSFILNDMMYYEFPHKVVASSTQQYHIVATGRASKAILFDQIFVFDNRLPDVDWKNASDQSINVDNQSFVSSVILDISKSNVPLDPDFPVTISYTRTLGDEIERVTLRPGTQKFVFDQVGQYSVVLRNTIWAKKTYNFEILMSGDTLVLVYDDGEQIEASQSDYLFTDPYEPSEAVYITRYVFTTNVSEGSLHSITDYQSHGLSFKEGNTNRVLAGYTDPKTGAKTDYYYYDNANNTLVWRLATPAGSTNGITDYVNPIYFATTGVSRDNLLNSSFGLLLNGNPNPGSGSATSGTFRVPAQATYHIIYNSFMDANHDKLEVSLYCGSDLRDDAGLPYNIVKGNTVLVDCYYNGQLVQVLNYGEVFTIQRHEAGYYEFAVHDLVGNYLYFGTGTDETKLDYSQNRYMLVVMTAPMVLINGQEPVSGMIYNDVVELKMVDYGHEFLSKLYASEIKADKEFFTKRFCVTKIEKIYTGYNNDTEVESILVNGTQSSFLWGNSGNYRIKLTYAIGNNISDYLEAEYQFQIVPSQIIKETFSMPIYPDIEVVSVTRDEYKIHDFDDLTVNNTMEFDAKINPGVYVVTLRTYNTILRKHVTHEVKFNIQHKADGASKYFLLSCDNGAGTTSAVTLRYNARWLYEIYGNVTIVLEKDFEQQSKFVVNGNTDMTGNMQELFTVSDPGLYTVIAYDAEGGVLYMPSWTIQETQSTFGYIILAVVLGIAGIGVLLFIRMRNKMTTK